MPNYSRIIVMGHLGRDAETKLLPSAVSVTQFSVAVTDKNKNGEETSWYDVAAFRLSDNFAALLKKGTAVLVDGKPKIRSFEAKDGTTKKVFEITSDRIELVGGKPKGEAAGVDLESVPF